MFVIEAWAHLMSHVRNYFKIRTFKFFFVKVPNQSCLKTKHIAKRKASYVSQ